MCSSIEPGGVAEALPMTAAGLDYLNSPAAADLAAAAACRHPAPARRGGGLA